MPQWRLGIPVLVTAAVLLLAGPAAAEQMYAWRTDDGAYSFTDDREAIPARYQDRAKLRQTGNLGDYRRFTPADGRSSDRYHQELAARLDREFGLQIPGTEVPPGVGEAHLETVLKSLALYEKPGR